MDALFTNPTLCQDGRVTDFYLDKKIKIGNDEAAKIVLNFKGVNPIHGR
jgi:hypothetical protein